MYEHMTIPGELTEFEFRALAQQLRRITLPNGRKPFTVEIWRNGAHHEIDMKNECCTAVLLFRMAPEQNQQ